MGWDVIWKGALPLTSCWLWDMWWDCLAEKHTLSELTSCWSSHGMWIPGRNKGHCHPLSVSHGMRILGRERQCPSHSVSLGYECMVRKGSSTAHLLFIMSMRIYISHHTKRIMLLTCYLSLDDLIKKKCLKGSITHRLHDEIIIC